MVCRSHVQLTSQIMHIVLIDISSASHRLYCSVYLFFSSSEAGGFGELLVAWQQNDATRRTTVCRMLLGYILEGHP